METRWVVFDIEGDGLDATKIYCLCWEDHEGNRGEEVDSNDIREFFQKYDCYVGHNIRRWDLPTLDRLLSIDVSTKRVIDTLALSWYLEPDRRTHNLESYGEDFGIKKPDVNDWFGLTLQEYLHRCREDVKINMRLWRDQLAHLQELYESSKDLWRFFRYIDAKMYAAALAEGSRWKLDQERCRDAIASLESERETRREELRRAMPKVPVVKEFTKPKRLYNADGELSALGLRWKDRVESRGLSIEYEGVIQETTGWNEPNPGSPAQLKSWLYSLGWKPRTIKYVRDKQSGNLKEIPQINKEHGGGVCDSILELVEKEPALSYLDGMSIASHRIGILKGFLRDAKDGHLTASVQGLTNTLRFKHAVLVNLPKVDKRYAKDIRSCLISEDDEELCGADMSSLEDKLKQHFIYPYDPDYVRKLQTEGYDPHLDLGVLLKDLSPNEGLSEKEADEYKDLNLRVENGEDLSPEDKQTYSRLKTARGIFKNGNYACQYGAGPPRLEITCGISRPAAKNLHEAYWKLNHAIRLVARDQRTKRVRDKNWLFNPLSRFWYVLRTEKDIFSTLVQGSGVYCFDTWVYLILHERPQITGQFHDEIILTVKRGFQNEVKDFLEQTIKDLNEHLNLRVPLSIGIQFGSTYADIH